LDCGLRNWKGRYDFALTAADASKGQMRSFTVSGCWASASDAISTADSWQLWHWATR
jgi:hypothetical protein